MGSAAVDILFAELDHAYRRSESESLLWGAICEDPARHARLVFAATEASPPYVFAAIGAPRLLAAAEWLCRDAERSGSWPTAVNIGKLAEELDISSAGRSDLLLVEDAALSLANCLAATREIGQ